MLSSDKWEQFGQDGIEVEGVIIHNTGNYKMSANDLFCWLQNDCKTSQGTHFLVDRNNVIQVMPETWKVWTTGKGNDYAFNHLLSIEICSDLNEEKYMQGQQKAVELIKSLMKKYGFGVDKIKFHNDYNKNVYCPCNILEKYKNRENFIKEVFEK